MGHHHHHLLLLLHHHLPHHLQRYSKVLPVQKDHVVVKDLLGHQDHQDHRVVQDQLDQMDHKDLQDYLPPLLVHPRVQRHVQLFAQPLAAPHLEEDRFPHIKTKDKRHNCDHYCTATTYRGNMTGDIWVIIMDVFDQDLASAMIRIYTKNVLIFYTKYFTDNK